MILLTRLNGTQLGINADLIERVESSGDTVVSLIDSTKYVVAESPADVVERIVQFRGRVLAEADRVLIDEGRTRAGLRLVVEQESDPSERTADAAGSTRPTAPITPITPGRS